MEDIVTNCKTLFDAKRRLHPDELPPLRTKANTMVVQLQWDGLLSTMISGVPTP